MTPGALPIRHDFNFVWDSVLSAQGVGGGAGDFAVGRLVIHALYAGNGG